MNKLIAQKIKMIAQKMIDDENYLLSNAIKEYNLSREEIIQVIRKYLKIANK